jgi:hypothetical protein
LLFGLAILAGNNHKYLQVPINCDSPPLGDFLGIFSMWDDVEVFFKDATFRFFDGPWATFFTRPCSPNTQAQVVFQTSGSWLESL